MRRELVTLAFAGFALLSSIGAAPAARDEAAAATTVAVQRVNVALPPVRDEAAMVLVGTALIGLAAAVRRAA